MNQNDNTRKNEDQKFTKTAPGEKQESKEANRSASPKPGEKGSERQAQDQVQENKSQH